MLGPRATLSELTGALEAAGVGLYVFEGSSRSQRWLAGAALFDQGGAGGLVHAEALASEPPGAVLRADGGAVDERMVRLPDGPDGAPRFVGVLRAAEGMREQPEGGPVGRAAGRSGFQAHLTALAERLPADAVVICAMFGVDGMREFCRAYGYEAGDALAAAVGRRIAASLPPEAAFARVGGAKFASALTDETPDAFRARAAGLAAALSETSFDVGFGPVSVTVSIGAAMARARALVSPEPIDAALAALDEASGEGEGGLHIAAAAAPEPAAMRAGARAVMRALEEDRVAIAFQPVVSASDPSRIAFRECLARVLDDDGQWLSAGLFLPKIERLDLVRTLDRRILKLALATLGSHATERLSINVSTRTMRDRGWIKDLHAAAEADPGAVERLIVELTESAAVTDPERTKAFLNEIRSLGVAIALDDFGAGYSSFRHVRDFRPDWVKIDGGFVRGVAEDADNKLFVDTLVGIARNFDMATVAEFVETDADAETLRALGVDCLQGYRFGKPAIEPDWEEAEAARG